MDYSSPANQLYALLHYSFALWLLFLLWPKLLFREWPEDRLGYRVSLFIKAVCLYIVIGYVLTALQLYELISVAAVLLLLSARRFWRKGGHEARRQAGLNLNVWFYELLEIGFRLKTRWMAYRGKLTMARKEVKGMQAWKAGTIQRIGLVAVAAGSAYLRFYDAVRSAAPALSDGAVTLAWMKYINARILFHDGIYPQGFHIILSLLSKFAAIDPLYILKYTGPLNGVLMVFSLYFSVSRMTGSRTAGLFAGALYGLGGTFLFGGDWERQAATNSQEFAFIFVFPAITFLLEYLKRGEREALRVSAAALTAAGLVHSLVFAFAGMGVGVALIASALTPSSRSWRRMGMAALAALGTVLASYAPIQLASWAGVPYNESAAEFLTDTTTVGYPELAVSDYAGLAAIGLTALAGLAFWKDNRIRLEEWFTVGFGTASFLLFYAAPALTGSTLLAARSESLWMLALMFCIGFAWQPVCRVIRPLRTHRRLEALAGLSLLVAAVCYIRPQPIVTYKMDWESMFRQYLKISAEHPPKTWTVFSQEEGYSLIYGIGWHQYIGTLVKQYDPAGTPLTRNGQDEYDPDVTRHMYVIEEKEVFKLPETTSVYAILKARYDKHEEEKILLKNWLDRYSEVHGKPPVYYEDEHIRIWYLERPEAKDKTQRRLWGAPS